MKKLHALALLGAVSFTVALSCGGKIDGSSVKVDNGGVGGASQPGDPELVGGTVDPAPPPPLPQNDATVDPQLDFDSGYTKPQEPPEPVDPDACAGCTPPDPGDAGVDPDADPTVPPPDPDAGLAVGDPDAAGPEQDAGCTTCETDN